MKNLVGQTLGHYRIEASLGYGGMGQVFRGRHVYLERPAAIKVMHEHLANHSTFRTRFLQEAKSTAALRSPHIVEVYEFGEQDGLLYLIMEMMTEGTLTTLLRQYDSKPIASVEHVGVGLAPTGRLITGLDLIRQAAEGLAAAHALGMIHRDIKPDNLLLTHLSSSDGQYHLKVSDFGLARLPERSGLTMGGPVGTPAYMSPEQCQNSTLDSRSDLYSLGVVLYEVVTGRPPFRIESFNEAVQKHVNASPPPLHQVCPGLPPIVSQIVLRCLAKMPEERYQTGKELAEALLQVINCAGLETDAPSEVPFVKGGEGELAPILPQPPQNNQTLQNHPVQVEARRLWPGQKQPHPFQSHTISATRRNPQTKIAGLVKRALRPGGLWVVDGVLLIGFLCFILITNMMSTVTQAPSSSHPTSTVVPQLNPNTVAHLEKKWVFPTGGSVYSSPAVVDGVVYVGSDDKNVYAIDAQSGQRKWAFPAESSVSSSPTVVGGVVYVGSGNGKVYAIDAQSGQQRWSTSAGNSQGVLSYIDPSPAVVNGVVYIGSDDGNVYAIDAQSGQQKWAFLTHGRVTSSPAVAGGVVYVGSTDQNVYAIDVLSGRQKWVFPARGYVESSPTVVDGVVYIGSSDISVYAIDARSGQKKWSLATGDSVYSSPAVVGGIAYVGSDDKNVYAIDAQSGQKKWTFQTGDLVFSSPTVVNNMVYVGSNDKNVYAFGLPKATP